MSAKTLRGQYRPSSTTSIISNTAVVPRPLAFFLHSVVCSIHGTMIWNDLLQASRGVLMALCTGCQGMLLANWHTLTGAAGMPPMLPDQR